MTAPPPASPPADADLVAPGRGYGLLDVWQRRFLTRLLIRKELHVRYQGSALGLAWTYVKPLIRYVIYLVFVGYVLGVGDRIENYAVFMFAGLVVVLFFNEAITSATRSISGNGGLIKKIYLPREMFPLVSVMVSAWHFLPQVVVLVGASLLAGWRPNATSIGLALAGFTLLFVLLIGLGLIFSTLNVYFRDAEQIIELLTLVTFWTAPLLYSWTFVRDILGDGPLFQLYLSNPLTVAVLLFQQAFWAPTVDNPPPLPPMAGPVTAAIAISVVTLLVGQWVFARRQGGFAQEL